MNKLATLVLVTVIILNSCAKRNFSYVDNQAFIEKLEKQTLMNYDEMRTSSPDLKNSRYYLGITLQDTFLGGELTFTQKAIFDHKEPCIQYCYLLFDQEDNVFYNTMSIENILDTMIIPEIPNEVGLDTLSIFDAPDALQGKYFIHGDTLQMMLESKEQDELVSIIAKLDPRDRNYFKIHRISRKRLTYSPLFKRKEDKSNQKVFDTEKVFSIDLLFERMPGNEKIVIRRDSLSKLSKQK